MRKGFSPTRDYSDMSPEGFDGSLAENMASAEQVKKI